MPVYSPRRAEFRAVLPGQDLRPLDIIAISEQVLGRSSPEWRALLVWARSVATGGSVGSSVRQHCIETGLSRSTFERRRRIACEMIADALRRAATESGEGVLITPPACALA